MRKKTSATKEKGSDLNDAGNKSDIFNELQSTISHILNPVEDLLANNNQANTEELLTIKENSHKLLKLVNQLSDSHKIKTEKITPKTITQQTETQNRNNKKKAFSTTRYRILIIDDNIAVRKYLSKLLSENYHVSVAEDGLTGTNLALELLPDLIISDILMPGLSGYELCKKLKSETTTAHIPIILLSGKSANADRLEGIGNDADAFITKPFNPHELEALIRNLIRNRFRTIEHLKTLEETLKTRKVKAQPKDIAFLDKLTATIDKNIDNEHFGVEELSRELMMSRSNLHRKLKTLKNMGPSQIIRDYRLNVALKLLKANSGTISEISFRVGFGSPSYFTKCFNDKFGYPPTDLKHQLIFEI